jgi:purine-binding chemotaxis protein CheW
MVDRAGAECTVERTENPGPAGSAGRYLTFVADGEEYGVDLSAVRELLDGVEVMPAAGMPEFASGTVNLRGESLPVCDFRKMVGRPSARPGPDSCVIVLEAHGLRCGMMVDQIDGVRMISAGDLEPPRRRDGSVVPGLVAVPGGGTGTIKLLHDLATLAVIDP